MESVQQTPPDELIPGSEALAAGRALFARLAPVSPDYVTLPILEGFNWSECLAAVAAGRWYLVTFRSVRRVGADEQVLTEFDGRAHREALSAAGLLYYFKGTLNARRECLSFCLWGSSQQARVAACLPLHREAVGITREMYDSYRLERYLLVKHPGSSQPELQLAD